MTFSTMIPSHLQSKKIRCCCSFVLLHHPSTLSYHPSSSSPSLSPLSPPSSFLVHKRTHPTRPSIALPGGRIEKGETAEMAAQREVWEEVGLWIPLEKFLLLGVVVEDFYLKYKITNKKNTKYNNNNNGNNNTYTESYGKYYFFEVFLTESDLQFEAIDNGDEVDPSFGIPHYNYHSFITLNEFFSFKYQHLIAKGLLDLYSTYCQESRKNRLQIITPTQKNNLMASNNNNGNSNEQSNISNNKNDNLNNNNNNASTEDHNTTAGGSTTPPLSINEVGKGFLSIPIPAPQPLPAPHPHRLHHRHSPPQRFRFNSADIAKGNTLSKPLIVDHWTTFPASRVQLWTKSKLIMEKFWQNNNENEEEEENNENNNNMHIEIIHPSTSSSTISLASVPLHHHHISSSSSSSSTTTTSSSISMDTCTPASSPTSLNSAPIRHSMGINNLNLHRAIAEWGTKHGDIINNNTSNNSSNNHNNNNNNYYTTSKSASPILSSRNHGPSIRDMNGSVASVLDLSDAKQHFNSNHYNNNNNHNINNTHTNYYDNTLAPPHVMNYSKSPQRMSWSENKESFDSSSPSKYPNNALAVNYFNYYPIISNNFIPNNNNNNYQQTNLFIRRDIPFLNMLPIADSRHYYH